MLVTDANLASAISVVRALGRRGDLVVAADDDPGSPGLRSRYATHRVVYPSPRHDGEGFIEAVGAAAREHRVDVVVPVTDEAITRLDASRERFDGLCRVAIADHEALAVARDKDRTVALARRLGVPVPRSAVAETRAEARRAAARLGWPVVLKPQASRVVREDEIAALQVSYAGGFASLEQQVGRLEGVCPVVVQEYCGGEGHGIELLLHRGRPLAAFQHRRLREVPVTGGASAFRESVPIDEELYAHAVRLLGELEWTGLAMVEFKVGPRGPRLMEINGRIWGSLPLAVKSGMDFPGRLVDLLVEGPPPAGAPVDTAYRLGVRSRNLDLEMIWIGSVLRTQRRYPFLRVPPRRRALAAALRLPLAADGYDVLARDDLVPGLIELVRVGGKLRRKLADAR